MPGALPISGLVDHYLNRECRIGIVLEPDDVLALCIAATRMFAGYGQILSLSPDADPADDETPKRTYAEVGRSPIRPVLIDQITPATELTSGEWAIIRPLFVLYVERQNAFLQEASRNLGADPYGRSSSEIASDIERAEEALPHKAFQQPVISI